MSEPRPLPYRPEIDGLRAVAVVSVILFHGGFPGWRGGFIGVDLFFVISGYLITGILAAELAGDRFSIWRFYERRIRRIIPALMLVMLLCIPLAFWLMLPDDLENFGQSLVGTTLFANNIVLLLTSGYFALENDFKPLMHSWSLGVEEQYYLLVPALMWVMWRLGKARGLLIGIGAVTLASFAASVWLSHLRPGFDFFMIFTRGWELGAGALAVLVEPRVRPMAGKTAAAALTAIGAVLIAIGLFMHHQSWSPGLLTAIPIAGMGLVLLFGGSSDPVGRVLSSRPFVGVGLISYSVYLFHQPVFVFARLVSLEQPRLALMAALIVPIFVLGWASWRFVEQPCRDRAKVSTRTLLAGSAAASLVVLAVGLTFHFTSGFYSRWPELSDGKTADRNANIAYNKAPDRFLTVSLPETGEKARVLVLGNSFARDFINMALETGRADTLVIAFRRVADCSRLNPKVIEQAKRAEFIVLATRFPASDVPCIVRHLDRLHRESSARIIVIGHKSFGYNNNAVMRLPLEQRRTWHVSPLPDAVAANDAARRTIPADSYVDVIAMLADAQGRVPVFTPEMKFISQDREHLTQPGARYVGGILFRHPALAAMLDAGNAPPPQKP